QRPTRPPCFTLFPYTTLFRSRSLSKVPLGLNLNSQEARGSNDSYLRAAVEKWLEKWSEENDVDIYTAGLKIYTTIDSRMQKIAEDRKSTRLNSSHVKISYAVF